MEVDSTSGGVHGNHDVDHVGDDEDDGDVLLVPDQGEIPKEEGANVVGGEEGGHVVAGGGVDEGGQGEENGEGVGGEEGGRVVAGGEVDEGGQGEENGEGMGDGESDVHDGSVHDGGVHACPGSLALVVDELLVAQIPHQAAEQPQTVLVLMADHQPQLQDLD